MSQTPPDEPADNISNKFPGLANKKPVKSISVQRPLDTDEKTVTESNLEPVETPSGATNSTAAANKPKTSRSTSRDSKPAEKAASGHTVRELPPSPGHGRANGRKRGGIITLWAVEGVTG